jgi:hypothetical protein
MQFEISDTTIIDSESNTRLTQRITFFEYLCVFILILYAGRANTFFDTLSVKNNPVGASVPLLLAAILALKWKIKFDSHFFGLLFGTIIYFLAVSIKYRVFHPTFLLDYFSIFFIVYVIIKALKFKVFLIYEYLLTILAIIGILFWIVQIGLRGDRLFEILNRIPGIELFSKVTSRGLNIIFYSVQPSYSSILYNFNIPRNCGFVWEPGAFAVYLCLAILINLFFIKSDTKGKNRLWILLVALISTLSTTGYIIFVVIILYYLLNKKLNLIILLLPFAVIAIVYLSSLPFMSKKVIELIDETKGIDQLLEGTYGMETASTPQRFTSFMLTFIDFRNNPVLGVGGHKEDTYTYKIGSNISAISGIGNLLAQFGLYGFIFFIILSYKSSFFFSRYYKYRGKFLLFIIILFISVSYSIIFIPMVMCFWMFHFFAAGNFDHKTEPDPVPESETTFAVNPNN